MKYRLAFAFLAALFFLGYTTAAAEAPSIPPAKNAAPKQLTVAEKVSIEFGKSSVMARIAYCESGLMQFSRDSVPLRGRVNNKDIGIFQINEKYHLDTANKLGYDIYTAEGNIKMARYIYEKQGTQPWSASRSCWGS